MYTVNTEYEVSVKKLEESFKKFNLNYKLYPYQSQNDWIKNCSFKPKFILEALEEFKTPIVFVDADAIIKQYPSYFEDVNCDISIRVEQDTVLSGTIFINNTEKAIGLITEWAYELDKDCSEWDQKSLTKIIKNNDTCKIINLPIEYIYIYDLFKGLFPDKIPVIEHYQLSRIARSKENGFVVDTAMQFEWKTILKVAMMYLQTINEDTIRLKTIDSKKSKLEIKDEINKSLFYYRNKSSDKFGVIVMSLNKMKEMI